jgi:hypothetical protein
MRRAYYFMGHYVMLSSRRLPTFRRNILITDIMFLSVGKQLPSCRTRYKVILFIYEFRRHVGHGGHSRHGRHSGHGGHSVPTSCVCVGCRSVG